MKNILRNRTLAIALALFLLMGMLTPLASAADFGDTSGHWGEAAIGKWADYGIIEGDGVNFRPDDPVTRGEFAVIVNRIAKYQKAAANTFSDLEAGLWYTDAMLKLNAAGVLNGDGGGRISPNGTLPREQAIAILARMFNVEPDASGLTGFSDAAAVDVWARAEVGGMAKAGYVQGSGGKLDPKGILTRSSAVKLFDNIIKGFYNTAGTYTIETDGIVVVNTTGVVLTNSKIGALFVTQGIGANGDFTLKNSDVQSFTVEGGGEHSIIIDNSTVGSLTVSVDSSTGNVRIHLTGGSEVEDAYVFVEGSEIVYFTNDTGTVVGSITVSEDGTIVVTGEVGEVNVIGDDVKVVVESSGKVGSINIEGDGATLDVSGTVAEVIVNGDDASVEGSGKVESVKVESGEGTEVTTGGTKVEVSENAGDVKTKDGEIKSGESDTTPENTGGGGGGGGPVGPTAQELAATLAATLNGIVPDCAEATGAVVTLSDSIVISNALTIPAGVTLEVESPSILEVSPGVTLTVNGTLIGEAGSTLTNNGTVTVGASGTISGAFASSLAAEAIGALHSGSFANEVVLSTGANDDAIAYAQRLVNMISDTATKEDRQDELNIIIRLKQLTDEVKVYIPNASLPGKGKDVNGNAGNSTGVFSSPDDIRDITEDIAKPTFKWVAKNDMPEYAVGHEKYAESGVASAKGYFDITVFTVAETTIECITYSQKGFHSFYKDSGYETTVVAILPVRSTIVNGNNGAHHSALSQSISTLPTTPASGSSEHTFNGIANGVNISGTLHVGTTSGSPSSSGDASVVHGLRYGSETNGFYEYIQVNFKRSNITTITISNQP